MNKILAFICSIIPFSWCKPTMVMTGDSVISLLGQYQGSYPEPFKSAKNVAVGGTETGQIKLVTEITKGYKIVLLEGGINNFIMNPPDPQNIVADYTAMLNSIPSSSRVILLGMIQVDESGPAAVGRPNSAIAPINAQLNALCALHPNCVAAVDAQNTSMVGLTLDGVHPTKAGYDVLINKIYPLVH